MATYGSSKANVMAVVKEVTAGTPVDPSGGTDYVALQPDFQLNPNFDQLDNQEIRASIGKAKTIQGLEQPDGSYSHYLKHSGTEGTAPEMGDMLESAFGSTSTNGTQRVLTGSSTTSLLKLASGGSDFTRGKAVLLKDATNNYQIRNCLSMSTNDMTLAFNLAVAPLTGLGLGKCVNYAPANSGHPTLTIHSYRGNGQLYEALAGAVVNDLSLSVQAGEMINSQFSFQGTKYYFNPIRIAASDIKLDFTDSGPTGFAATITAKLYRDPHELAQAIQDAMNGVGAVDTYTVTFMNNDATNFGKFKIASSGTAFTLKWNTGTNTANSVGDKIGYSLASDDTGALFYYSDTVMSWASPFTPTFDSTDPIAAKYLEVMIGGATDYACFCAQSVKIQVQNTVSNILCICAESGVDQKKVTGRQVTISVTALIDKHDADKFKRYRSNSDTAFAFNFGVRDGGNWVAGKCGNVYVPTCTVSKFNLTDLDTVIGMELELSGFVDSSGNGEVYLNFL